MKFAFYTLGCKVNQYETQAMEQLLLQKGHSIGSFEEACDGYIINTCSVTAVADKKNRNMIRRCRREHPQAIVAVCGCYSQHDPQAAQKLGADLIGGSANREQFLDSLLALFSHPSCGAATYLPLGGKVPPKGADEGPTHPKPSPVGTGVPDGPQRLPCVKGAVTAQAVTEGLPCLDDPLKRRQFEILPPGGLEGRTRAMLKVQDGCRNFCTYCIIPYTRGPVRSAPLDLAVAQAKALGEKGYREIVITGIEIASWGVDLPGKPPLTDLLRAICEAVPQMRIRLGSLEPRCITEEFCLALKNYPNLCPQFHLSMQSGSDSVLARMKRKYDTNRYYESILLLRRHFPDCAITTDMIVAFPGETEAEFAESLAFIQKCGFAEMHIFPYSRRPGTPADKLPGQHDNATKEARSKAAIAVAKAMNEAYRKALIGTTLQVLFEEPEGQFYTGHAPNYVKVYCKAENLHNQCLPVTITGLHGDGLTGTLAPQEKI